MAAEIGKIKPLFPVATSYVVNITIYGPPREDLSSNQKARKENFDNKRLLNDIENYPDRWRITLTKVRIILDIMRKPNPIIVLL